MDNSCVLDLLIRCFAMTEPDDLNFTAFTDLCRLCSLKSGPRLHIFDKDGEQRQILFKIRSCLPTMISKDDFLPKKICERCVTRLEQLFEWRQNCLNTDTVLRNYAESMRVVTSTINFQDGTVNMEKMTEAQKTAYLEAHVAVQQHMAAAAHAARREAAPAPPAHHHHQYSAVGSPIKVPQVSSSTGATDSTFTVPDDVGLGYEGGVRVLQSLGSWSPEVTSNIPRPNLIPFTEPYAEGGSMNPASRLKALQGGSHRKHSSNPKPTSSNNDGNKAFECTVCGKGLARKDKLTIHMRIHTGDKAFECTVCGKGMARKDKLTIHMRIHTGEKPYVCEVCNKAFARRDKLVLHMNKLKHLTPSNIAPLGKRSITVAPIKIDDVKPLTMNLGGSGVKQQQQQQQQEDTKPNPAEMGGSGGGGQGQQHGSNNNSHHQHQQLQQSGLHHHAGSNSMVVSWSCELCGRMFSTRDEWTAHAKSHLGDKMVLGSSGGGGGGGGGGNPPTSANSATNSNGQDNKMQTQQSQQQNHQDKLQLLHQHNQGQQALLNGHSLGLAAGGGEQAAAAYFPAGTPYGGLHHAPAAHAHHHGHHLCLMCRQEFQGKAEFMFHVRGHFEGKVSDLTAADMLARSLMDNSGLCT